MCRVKTLGGQRLFEFKAEATASYINAGTNAPVTEPQAPAAHYHSIVQDLAWPSPQDEAPIEGHAPVQPQHTKPWFQQDLLAHTLQFRQMLQPAVTAVQLQVCLVCSTTSYFIYSDPHHVSKMLCAS